MFCDECHLRPVAIKLTMSADGQTLERALCQICGQKYAAMGGVPMQMPSHAPFALLSGMLAPAQAPGATLPGPARCEHCGYSFHQFQQSGMLGCPGCYDSFSPQMEVVLRRAHGGTVQHAGKTPARSASGLKQRREIERLTRDMEKAVQDQRFEEAARLRDRIRALEKEMRDEPRA